MTKEQVLAETIDAFADGVIASICLAFGFILAITIFTKKDD